MTFEQWWLENQDKFPAVSYDAAMKAWLDGKKKSENGQRRCMGGK